MTAPQQDIVRDKNYIAVFRGTDIILTKKSGNFSWHITYINDSNVYLGYETFFPENLKGNRFLASKI